MKMEKITLEVYLGVEDVSDAELRAGESYTIETVAGATTAAVAREFAGDVQVVVVGHAICERSTFDLETGERIR
ncbi:MAG TPA: hypothetical protein VFT76_02065 [Actinomycetota bacterium]|nr:hypothetical protein [Actinomycetota bacterium]